MKKYSESEIDKLFNIETCLFDNSKEDANHRAYEPTPYSVLDLIVDGEHYNVTEFQPFFRQKAANATVSHRESNEKSLEKQYIFII